MQSKLKNCGLVAICGLLMHATPISAALVGTMHWHAEANPSQVCLSGTYDNASQAVFGTPINLGDAGGVFCYLQNNGAAWVGTCTSTPDAGQFTYDVSVPAAGGPPTLPPTGVPQPYVGAVTSYSGSVVAPLGPVTMTFDGTLTYDGTSVGSPTISGCPISGGVAQFSGQTGINAFQTVTTSTGSDVAVTSTATFVDQVTGQQRSADVAVTFANVTGAGETIVSATSNAAGDISSNFSINIGGLDPIFLDITTTAVITGPITVCQHYPDANDDGVVDGTGVAATDLRILHGEGSNPVVFVDRTVLPVDTVYKLVCASVTSLSPFVLAVNVTNTSTHDSVVRPVAPVKITIPSGKTAVSKTLSLAVLNADLTETAGHTIQLAVTASTCPAALLPGGVDFDPKSTGAQSSILVPGGKVKVGKLALNVQSADFTSPNLKSPARCTLTLTASAVTSDTVIEPNQSNNQITVDLEVIDKNDFAP